MLEGHKISEGYLKDKLPNIKQNLSYNEGYKFFRKIPRIILDKDYPDLYIKDEPRKIFEMLVNAWFYNEFIVHRKKEAKQYLEHAKELNITCQLSENFDFWKSILWFKWGKDDWQMTFKDLSKNELERASKILLTDISEYTIPQTVYVLDLLKERDVSIASYKEDIRLYRDEKSKLMENEFQERINKLEIEIKKSEEKISDLTADRMQLEENFTKELKKFTELIGERRILIEELYNEYKKEIDKINGFLEKIE